LENGKGVFVFGIGLGEQIDFLIEQFPGRKIRVWDRDPWLVRLFLMQKDYSEAISSRNLILLMGTDLLSYSPRIDEFTVIYHPLLKEIYHNEAELILSGVSDKRILINDGGLFVDDVVRFLKDFGYTPFYLNLSKISMEEIEYAIIQFMPSIIFSINYQNGLSELSQKFSMKLLCWEIDPSIDVPVSILEKNEKAHIFTYRKQSIDDFIASGFQNVYYLPLASNVKKRHPEVLSEEENRYICPVSFVGSSMAGQAEEYMKSLENYYKAFCRHHRISCDESMNPFKKILKIQARDYSTYRIPELSQTYLGDFLRYLKENTDQPVDPVNLLAEKAASEKRLTYLSQLGRYSLKVWGDEGWKRLESEGLRYMGYAGHKYEINKIYSASTINIDINRLYQADMVNMRVFDIMACGGFVIAEHSEDLKELFEIDDEVVTFRTFGELLEKVDYYLSNTDKAREISYRGMTAVRERHTIQNRVKHMLSIVNKESYL
jgi:spore maturation protein CgeB